MDPTRSKPRFYVGGWTGDTVPMQVTHSSTVPEPIARLAWTEYQRRFSGQTFENFFHRRGGFSSSELISLLADALERLEVE